VKLAEYPTVSGLQRSGLDHRQGQAQHGLRAVERQSAVKSDTGPGQVEMIVRPKQRAARRDQRPGRGHTVRHRGERLQLGCVLRMLRVIRAGQMRHDQFQRPAFQPRTNSRPIRRFQPKAVHARIKLDAIGMTGQGIPVSRGLFGAVQKRDQVMIPQQRGIACHMT